MAVTGRHESRSKPLRKYTIAKIIILIASVTLSIAFERLSRPYSPQTRTLDEQASRLLDDQANLVTETLRQAVVPAMQRTDLFAKDPQIIHALRENDGAGVQKLLNRAIQQSTEIDAIAGFDSHGQFIAINSVYADGKTVDPLRLARLRQLKFDREIIQGCVRNTSDTPLLEFQLQCDITPALFDSSGLSVAYSKPVMDSDGKKVGVVSSRMRFERLNRILESSDFAKRAGNGLFFVADSGRVFDESMNSNKTAPPLVPEQLNSLLKPLISGKGQSVVTAMPCGLVYIFSVPSLTTVSGGGIHLMMLAGNDWIGQRAASAVTVRRATATVIGLGIGVIGLILVSMFEQRIAMKEVQAARKLAEAATLAKSSFLANMSHEIRTPMTAILGYADMLQDNTLSHQQQAQNIQTIKSSGNHLLSIINDILDFSKIEAGQMSLESIDFAPFEIVEDVRHMMAMRASGKGLKLEVEYAWPIPAKQLGDPTRLRQILVNMVGNAIKFTEAGSVRIRVAMKSGTAPELLIEVIDTGIGISAEGIARLFKPFSQADNSTTRVFGGTGLGLAISSRLCAQMGGELSVRSTPGEGSTFTVRLPIRVKSTLTLMNAEPLKIVTEAPKPALAMVLAGKRVLLVEDGLDNQHLISFIVRKLGGDVQVAGNGQLGADAAINAQKDGRPFDLILMDMQMPVLDGYGATALIRKHGIATPIVALTANAMAGDRDRCLAAGCNHYLAKPIDRAEFIRVCDEQLHTQHRKAA